MGSKLPKSDPSRPRSPKKELEVLIDMFTGDVEAAKTAIRAASSRLESMEMMVELLKRIAPDVKESEEGV